MSNMLLRIFSCLGCTKYIGRYALTSYVECSLSLLKCERFNYISEVMAGSGSNRYSIDNREY